ncbi:potassium channel family protein [Sedimentitalea nanhaiensis]|uniref:Ion channel n=1 Tax=Sedimentitalea nanhaiensis TaxID=999627 RepID=A0A1I7DNA5_9RHOB|nr:potassium channel family protein [Sedimentitalea nanhaiensis]SFU13162.1 Ion channel [Sedimentitalea nanhaiensis]
MSLMQQILWGSGFLGLCLLLHVASLALGMHVLTLAMRWVARLRPAAQTAIALTLVLSTLLASLTAQTWIWSIFWISNGTLPDWNTAVYFSLVTFTALGYGDVVLGPEARVFASFAAVTGLLGFGLSSAFLVAVMTRLLTELYPRHRSGANKRAKGAP